MHGVIFISELTVTLRLQISQKLGSNRSGGRTGLWSEGMRKFSIELSG